MSRGPQRHLLIRGLDHSGTMTLQSARRPITRSQDWVQLELLLQQIQLPTFRLSLSNWKVWARS